MGKCHILPFILNLVAFKREFDRRTHQLARAHWPGELSCARQQIQKTKAHLTGAVVPSSDERWNHFESQYRWPPIWPPTAPPLNGLHRSFLLEGMMIDKREQS